MSELELSILLFATLFGWVALLHWRIHGLMASQEQMGDHLRGVADQVNRLQREVRGR